VSKLQANPVPELNRRKAFQATASDLDATFVAGKLRSGDQVHLQHGPWRVILATCVVNHGQNPLTYTRARAFYVAREDFTLRVSRRNIFTRVAEIFGSHGLRIGDQEFERKYTIKNSNQPRGRSLMMNWRLRELIMGEPSLRLEIRRLPWGKRRKTGDGVRAMAVQTIGVTREQGRLVDYVRLVVATLDRLLKIGGAHDEPVAKSRTYTLSRRV
jgi:hypothetical protein